MNSSAQKPASNNWWRWFDPRGREAGTWAFILNRITALGLTFYLFLHLIILRQLADGPAAYDHFLEIIHNPVFIFVELLVVWAGLIHGLNGIRVGLNSFGIAVNYQKQLFIGLMVAALAVGLYFAVRMFAAL